MHKSVWPKNKKEKRFKKQIWVMMKKKNKKKMMEKNKKM